MGNTTDALNLMHHIDEIYNILDKRKLIDHTKTYLDNPNYDLYESEILETDKQFVK